MIVIIDLIENVFTDSVEITWADSNGPLVAFIDNITFHPVPEPGTLALLAFSLLALLMGRRWMM